VYENKKKKKPRCPVRDEKAIGKKKVLEFPIGVWVNTHIHPACAWWRELLPTPPLN
jgi:hypothetical protein